MNILEHINIDKWFRASGECICTCGLKYKQHKDYKVNEFLYLTLLCDNSLVKL